MIEFSECANTQKPQLNIRFPAANLEPGTVISLDTLKVKKVASEDSGMGWFGGISMIILQSLTPAALVQII